MINVKAEDVYFTSDTHFHHANIINHCNRPFANVIEMDEALIDNWNRTVPKNALVVHCGDFVWKASPESEKYQNMIKKLNGQILCVGGNHDKGEDRIMMINVIESRGTVTQHQKIVCCHYPMIAWNQSFRGSWQVFGHIHTTPENRLSYTCNMRPTQYDVGVDNNNFRPISYFELKGIINEQIFTKQQSWTQQPL